MCEMLVFNPNFPTTWKETRWSRHKGADLFFHKKGTVNAAASGNPKNRNRPTFLLSSKTNPRPIILHKGVKQMPRTLQWFTAWLRVKAQSLQWSYEVLSDLPPQAPPSTSENLLCLFPSQQFPSNHTGNILWPATVFSKKPPWLTASYTSTYPQGSHPTPGQVPEPSCPHPALLYSTWTSSSMESQHLEDSVWLTTHIQ